MFEPPNGTPLRPGSTFIDEMNFQKQYRLKDTAILCGITFENPSINVEPERKDVAYGGFVETHLSRRF